MKPLDPTRAKRPNDVREGFLRNERQLDPTRAKKAQRIREKAVQMCERQLNSTRAKRPNGVEEKAVQESCSNTDCKKDQPKDEAGLHNKGQQNMLPLNDYMTYGCACAHVVRPCVMYATQHYDRPCGP